MEVDATSQRVLAYDGDGQLVAANPATVAARSDHLHEVR